MSNQTNTGFLCEYGDAEIIVCGRDAMIELEKSEMDADGPETYNAFACDQHAEVMRQNHPDYEVSVLPILQVVGA
jgi:hypothetical protein